jgi:hypothetical protein
LNQAVPVLVMIDHLTLVDRYISAGVLLEKLWELTPECFTLSLKLGVLLAPRGIQLN